MKLSVKMDHDFGGYDINKYQIRISRHGGGVVSVGFPNNDPGMQKGVRAGDPCGRCGQARLRSALLIASHGSETPGGNLSRNDIGYLS
jgi:hypothetical protein